LRSKKTFKNVAWGFVYEAVAIVCALILPRLILTSFGSQYNGVIGAVTQFLSVIALFQAGVGGVTMAALYKPLAEKNTVRVSVIVKSTESFMHKVVFIFVGAIVCIACLYPFLVIDEFDWFFTASLVLIMSLSTVAQYFFGQTYQFLLNADQHQRVISIVNSVKLIANTAISAVMIHMGFGIRAVKLSAAAVYVISPLFISVYAKRKYKIIADVKKDNSVISQRWDNFGQQIAMFVTQNTDIIVLSLFSTVYEVSVYTVYALVFSGVYGIFVPLTKGVEAAFGNMIAKNEHDKLKENLRIYEQVVFTATTFLFTVAFITTISFVLIYTANVSDVDYRRPVFLYIMIIAFMFKCFRFPYEGIVKAAGHFRQTRNPAFIEAAINISVSVALVIKFGIAGVAIGTLFAFIYRTVLYAVYISRNIVRRSLLQFFKRLAVSFGCLLSAFALSLVVPLPIAHNFFSWARGAVVVAVVAFILVATAEVLFYRSDLLKFINMAKGILKKRKAKVSA
jgi:O-antigen/teichoic acid export membrane protein